MHPETETAIANIKEANQTMYLSMLIFARAWSKTRFTQFSSEDIKEEYYAGNDKPKDGRLWGAVMKELAQEKAIYFIGYQQYRNPAGHNRPSSVWISAEFSRMQSEKGSKPKKRIENQNNQSNLLNQLHNGTI